MHVGICEDEEIYKKLVAEKVTVFFAQHGETPVLDVFSDGAPFLQRMQQGIRYDLILLDLQLEHSDGMDIAEKLRKLDAKVPIIFVTGMENRAAEGYSVEAMDYVVKSKLDERLPKALSRFWEKRKDSCLLFETSEGETVILSFRDILWVESQGRGVKVSTAKKEFINSSLPVGKVTAQLPEADFLEIYKSVYAQVREIKRIGTDQVIMSNEAALPLSRRRRKAVMVKVLESVKGRLT